MKKTIAVTSVYCNPIHPGHIDCFEMAKELADELWVVVNNDHQAELKRGVPSFQEQGFRMRVVSSIKPVNKVFLSIDMDATVCKSLEMVFKKIKQTYGEDTEIIFAKGGDRFAHEIPEAKVCKDNNVRIIDGLGNKTYNSSDYINKPM